jgi:predicted  nucleic acid-binding Zn-ribbon protein
LLDRYVQQLEDARNEVLMNEAYLERVESSLELDRQTEVTESRMLAELTSEFLQSTARINAIKDEKRRVQTETARLEKQLRVEESKYEMNIQEKADLQQKAHKAGMAYS